MRAATQITTMPSASIRTIQRSRRDVHATEANRRKASR